MKTELLEMLEYLVEDCKSYTTGLSCVGCAGEQEYDEELNEYEVVHKPDCTIMRAQELIRRAQKKPDPLLQALPDPLLQALRAINKLKWGTNIMGEKLCPICNSSGRHKRDCPYPLIEKALAATAVKT